MNVENMNIQQEINNILGSFYDTIHGNIWISVDGLVWNSITDSISRNIEHKIEEYEYTSSNR